MIFISIDDNEQAQLKLLCDEVFGAENFLANLIWQKKYAATNDAKGFSTLHDYIMVYQKGFEFERNLLPRTEAQNKPYKMMMEMEKVYGEVIICWLSRFRPVLFIRLEIQIQEKNFFRHKVVLGEPVNQQWKFG